MSEKKRIAVLGGDGYLGWPCALHFAEQGHEVAIVDNGVRRRYDAELHTDSLLPLPLWGDRMALVPPNVGFYHIDVAGEHRELDRFFEAWRPDVVVHFAEQRSAPYSMIDREHCLYTHTNNVSGTLNVLHAMRDHCPGAHLIKLGSMGEYGTPNIDIEEGFIEIEHRGRRDVLPFPKQPGSWYHLTKVHDSNNIMFACKTWGLVSTDLNQGIVYGVETDECPAESERCTRYDYDGIFGTCLNRFCVQAAIGMPLTVYGKGGQTRGYIDIRDSMRCIELAMLNPPGSDGDMDRKPPSSADRSVSPDAAADDLGHEPSGGAATSCPRKPDMDQGGSGDMNQGAERRLRVPGSFGRPLSPIPTFAVFNQITEVFAVNQLARMVQEAGRELGLAVTIRHIDNPRVEAEKHYYQPAMDRFKVLGLQARPLTATIPHLIELALKHRERVREGTILPGVRWRGAVSLNATGRRGGCW